MQQQSGETHYTHIVNLWLSWDLAELIDSDTLMVARSQPNDIWGSVGNGAKHGGKHVRSGSGM